MRILATFLALLTLCSCDAPVYQGSVRTASFDPQFKMPEKMLFSTRGDQLAMSALGVVGGLVGGALGAAVIPHKKQTQSLKDFVQQDFERALTEEINKTGKLTIVPGGKGA